MSVESIITENLDVWTSAIKTKSASGRGSSNKRELYGIKKLRELILDLAVRGKLVHQDPSDEPAVLLLERIKAQKVGLIKDELIKKPKTLPTFSESDVPFELPESWSWTYLQDVTSYIQRGKGPKYAEEGNVKVISQKCIQNSGFSDAQARFIADESLGSYGEERYLKESDLLWNSTGTGTVGRINVLPNIQNQILVADSHVTVIRPLCIQSWYLWCFISSPTVQMRIAPDHENSLVSGSTKQVELNTSAVQSLLVPVAPLQEQARIVKRVNDLMTLCDQLESQTEASIEAHQTLVKSLLETLTNAKDADELNESWQRISEHFDVLFTTEDSIDQLKQTILQLAVMGKLVKQDPNDEPASKLLERIAVEKQQQIKDKKIKKTQKLPLLTDSEMEFQLPTGWQWCKFGELAEFINGDRGKNYPNKAEYVSEGIPWINTGHITKNGLLSESEMNFITQEKFDSLRSGKVKKGDLVYCLRGATFGKTAFVEPFNHGAIASSLMIIRLHKLELSQFVYWYLISPFGRSQIFRFDNGSAQPNLSANSVKLYAFPLPPLAEQYRLVEKIKKLFSVCERLKQSLSSAQTMQIKFSDSISNNLGNS